MNYTGLTDFFNLLIFQNTVTDTSKTAKEVLSNAKLEHEKHSNEHGYIRRFDALYRRSDKIQKGFLSLFYVRVFIEARFIAKRPVAIYWKKIDNDIMGILKQQIEDSDSEPEGLKLMLKHKVLIRQPEDNSKLADDIKKRVLEDLEKKRHDDDNKAEQERKERIRIKKINKRRRAKERKAETKNIATTTEEDTESDENKADENDTMRQMILLQEAINEGDEHAEVKQIEPAPVKQIEPAPVHQIEPAPVHQIEPAPVHQIEPAPVHQIEQSEVRQIEQLDNKRPAKFDYTKCPCGSKTARKDLHEKTARHKNYIDFNIIHKNKSQTERNIRRYMKNKQIITRCVCGEEVKRSSKQLHEQSKKHKYFMEHGSKIPGGNYMMRCECGIHFMRYNLARHRNTTGHIDYMKSIQGL